VALTRTGGFFATLGSGGPVRVGSSVGMWRARCAPLRARRASLGAPVGTEYGGCPRLGAVRCGRHKPKARSVLNRRWGVLSATAEVSRARNGADFVGADPAARGSVDLGAVGQPGGAIPLYPDESGLGMARSEPLQQDTYCRAAPSWSRRCSNDQISARGNQAAGTSPRGRERAF
jgi:hypothetical protein